MLLKILKYYTQHRPKCGVGIWNKLEEYLFFFLNEKKGKEIFSKVKCFKEVIPADEVMSMNRYHTFPNAPLPGFKVTVGSTLRGQRSCLGVL